MIKKISLLFLVFLMLSCSSSRSVIRTTSNTKTTTAKKKVVSTTDTKQSKSQIESNQKNKNGDEIQDFSIGNALRIYCIGPHIILNTAAHKKISNY